MPPCPLGHHATGAGTHMSSKATDQTDFHGENSSDIDYSAAENNLPDHVTPAVINVEENSQVMNCVQPLQNLQPVIQPKKDHRG